jgi:hypothetical protein
LRDPENPIVKAYRITENNFFETELKIVET